eukprot:COSAG01_NODE_53746_length_337_cov_0.457983_2_plen_36_part_01
MCETWMKTYRRYIACPGEVLPLDQSEFTIRAFFVDM